MSLEEIELDDLIAVFEEAPQIAQSPGATLHGLAGEVLEPLDGMLPRQLEQALQNAQPIRPAVGQHRFGPGAGVGPEYPASLEEIVGPAFDGVAFAIGHMRV